MKKITINLLFVLICALTHAQEHGLRGIIVEKYYVSSVSDSICNDAVANSPGMLSSGSVTWRVFADITAVILPGCYGSPTHTLNISTTGTFFNNDDRGDLVSLPIK